MILPQSLWVRAGLTIACAGCCGAELSPGLTDRFIINPGTAQVACSYSADVVVLSDTHAHHLYTKGNYAQSLLADKLSNTAIRVPQTDIYGPAVERWMLDNYAVGKTLVHLGDTTDVSCDDEFDAFAALMRGRKMYSPWFVAPGNHDGYYFGVADHVAKSLFADIAPNWVAACSFGAKPLTKDMFLRRYLGELRAQGAMTHPPPAGLQGLDDPGLEALARDLPADVNAIPEKHDFDVPLGTQAILRAASWRIYSATDGPAPRWSSFLVQEIDLTDRSGQSGHPCVSDAGIHVVGILLDTASYSSRPNLVAPAIGGPGSDGEIPAEEQAIVEGWVRAAAKAGARVILFGHHHSLALNNPSRAFLAHLHADYGAALYVSAHDHLGKWMSIPTAKGSLLELNIGSMLDAPIEFRDLRLGRATTDETVVVSELTRFDQKLERRQHPACATRSQAWEAQPQGAHPADLDFYLSYKDLGLYDPSGTAVKMLNVALASRGRFLASVKVKDGTWPSALGAIAETQQRIIASMASPDADQKVSLLRQLNAAVEQAESDPPSDKEDFAVCQAYWASKYEWLGRRIPDVTDWSVTLPKEH